jgi:hypothetical protein
MASMVAYTKVVRPGSSHFLTFPIDGSHGLQSSNEIPPVLRGHRKIAMLNARFPVHRDGKGLAVIREFEYGNRKLKFYRNWIRAL